jgi:hypothetical protein
VTHVVTIATVLAFIAGLMSGQLVNWVQYRWRIKKHPETVVKRSYWEPVIAVMVVVVLVWIMVSTNQARNCAVQLNNSISNEQAISKIERDALENLLFQAISPPPDIANLPQDDPRKQAWGKELGSQYITQVQTAARKRGENQVLADQARKACGT